MGKRQRNRPPQALSGARHQNHLSIEGESHEKRL
jgi:hypothetical protein